jgi:Transposase DDE domain group 1
VGALTAQLLHRRMGANQQMRWSPRGAQRMLMIAAGYEDANDADGLRRDPAFKLALNRLPSGGDLCSQPTVSRLENLPGARALLRMGQAMPKLDSETLPRTRGALISLRFSPPDPARR